MRALLLASLVLLPVIVFAQGTSFVPLTNIPGLTDTGNSPDLPLFLNNIYRICIGLAAVLAVLQIIRAGIMYMASDTGVTEKKEAKNLIWLSILGLLLVLSPVLVFSIINKDILELNLDVKGLSTHKATNETVQIPFTTAEACKAQGGTVGGSTFGATCTVPANSNAAVGSGACTNFTGFRAVPVGESCGSQNQMSLYNQKVADSCCSALQEGYKCCGTAKLSTAVDVSRDILATKYVTAGQPPREWVITPSDYVGYDKYIAACTTAGGTAKEVTSGTIQPCTGQNAVSDPTQRCQEVRVSCTISK